MRAIQGQHFGRHGLPTPRRPALPAPGASNPLREYFDAHLEGPGIWKWQHYFEIYDRHLARFVGESPTILEVGVYSGGSLGMWHEYFGPGARVIGVDIQPECRAYADDNTTIYIGDQADPHFWQDVTEREPNIDVVIDDGGHLPRQQIATLEALLPHLRPGGVFICEDVIHRQNPFFAYASGLASNFNELTTAPNAVQDLVASVAFYPFVCVIEKRADTIGELTAPKHGTMWQPFLDPR